MASRSDFRRVKSTSGFYVLTPGWATKYFFASVDADLMGDASVDWSYRELADFKGTAILDIKSGTTPGDFIRNDTLLMVVSARLIEELKKHGIGNYSTFKVKVVRNGDEVPEYVGLAVLGKGGPNDPSLVSYPNPGSKQRRIDGLRPTKWDGSDLFTLDDAYRVVLVTDRVRRIFRREKVTNCLFEPAEEFKIPY
jgi:hypothetical protein